MKILSWVTTKIRKISHWLQAFFINNIRIHIQYTEPDLSKPLGSGSGYHTSCRYNDIKLVRHKDIIGKGIHRSGWPWVHDNLKTIHSCDGILFDDFFEQNFCYKDAPDTYTEPWVTIIHHPANIPSFGNHRERLDAVFESKAFKDSEPYLKLVFALSDNLADWLRTKLTCTVISLKHPGFLDVKSTWLPSKNKEVYQLGFYLRNTSLCDQIKLPEGVTVKKLWNSLPWLQPYHNKVQSYWEANGRTSRRDTECVSFVTPSKYDQILNTKIIIAEYFEASASNVVLECIAHHTPLIVNRLPAFEQYLGKGYPLFYDNIDEIPMLIDQAAVGHYYLKTLPTQDLQIDYFLNKIKEEIYNI